MKLLKTELDLNMLGNDVAVAMINRDNDTNQVKRDLLLDTASLYAGDELATNHILKGYENAYINNDCSPAQARARKSEFKAVFDAVAKTLVSGDNLNMLRECAVYVEMIKSARVLRDIGKAPKAPANVVKALSPQQLEEVESKLERANVDNIVTITSHLTNKLATFNDADSLNGLRQLKLIAQICDSTMQGLQLDKATSTVFESVLNQVSQLIDTLEIVKLESNKEVKQQAA